MNETEWLASENPIAPLAYVAPRTTDRKLRLFLCACCARVLEGTPPNRRLFRGSYAGSFEQLKRALSLVEQFAEGLVGSDALAEARRDAKDSEYVPASVDYGGETGLDYEAATVIAAAADRPNAEAVVQACWRATESQVPRTAITDDSRRAEEARWQTMVLREIFGNPFRTVTFDPAWRTSTAVAIAKGMYQSRDFSPMPILADALQDAGCENADILNHCRDEKATHVRGCWVVDLVLGKV